MEKSHGILKWSFPGLEKSWKKRKSQKPWKSPVNPLVNMCENPDGHIGARQ